MAVQSTRPYCSRIPRKSRGPSATPKKFQWEEGVQSFKKEVLKRNTHAQTTTPVFERISSRQDASFGNRQQREGSLRETGNRTTADKLDPKGGDPRKAGIKKKKKSGKFTPGFSSQRAHCSVTTEGKKKAVATRSVRVIAAEVSGGGGG